jgi:hypothetical protein
MKKQLIIICVLVYTLTVSLALVWNILRTKPVYVSVPAVERRGEVSGAVASALAAVKEEKLLRGSVYKLIAVRDKQSKDTWVVTFLFEDPPIIGGDVIATVHADGKVTVVPGF